MGAKVGAIPSAVGGHEIQLSHVGTVFPATAENLARWREWMRYVHADQIWVWGLFCFLGMFLNVNLATAIIPHGTDLQGLAAGAYQAEYLSEDLAGLLVPHPVQRLLDPVQDPARQHRHPGAHGHGRRVDGEPARARVAGAASARSTTACWSLFSVWGVFAIRSASPFQLFKILANMAGVVLLDRAASRSSSSTAASCRGPCAPPLWREVGLLACSAFYAFFTYFACATSCAPSWPEPS